MEVRPARPGELAAVMTVFDAGGLETALEAVETALADGRLFVAAEGDRVLGALMVGPAARSPADEPGAAEIAAIAVQPSRRGRGVGSRLVAAAADRHGRLVAGFDAGVRPFWASLGFAIEPAGEPDRYRGRLSTEPDGP